MWPPRKAVASSREGTGLSIGRSAFSRLGNHGRLSCGALRNPFQAALDLAAAGVCVTAIRAGPARRTIGAIRAHPDRPVHARHDHDVRAHPLLVPAGGTARRRFHVAEDRCRSDRLASGIWPIRSPTPWRRGRRRHDPIMVWSRTPQRCHPMIGSSVPAIGLTAGVQRCGATDRRLGRFSSPSLADNPAHRPRSARMPQAAWEAEEPTSLGGPSAANARRWQGSRRCRC
jgi:hypothetical protein